MVIDTPGFLNTRGLERDEEIITQIKHFFSLSSSEGNDHVDGIGFVIQSSLARLSPTQKYTVDVILSVFGRDMASNIFLIPTFADSSYPPVIDTIKTHIKCANSPVPLDTDELRFFKFNNSCLFKSQQYMNIFDKMFWELGYNNFHNLFNYLGQAVPQTLKLTKDVLDECSKLQLLIQSVREHKYKGTNSLEEMHSQIVILKECDANMRTWQHFTYEKPVGRQKRELLPEHTVTVKCLVCDYTCVPYWHTGGSYKEEDKQYCSAMDSSGFCTVCPSRCMWKSHVSNNYRFVFYMETERRIVPELEEKYMQAKKDRADMEKLIINTK